MTAEPVQADLESIKEIICAYPYFYPAYALHSKLIKETGSVGFEKSLALAAAYSPDRTLLHEFIHSSSAEKETALASTKVEEIVEQKNSAAVKPTVETNEPLSPVHSVAHPEPEVRADDTDAYQKHRLVSIIEERLEVREEEPEQKSVPEHQSAIKDPEKESSPEEVTTDAFIKPETVQPRTFTGWLKYFSFQKAENTEITQQNTASGAKSESGQPVIMNTAAEDASAKAETNTSDDTTSIIDKFIAEEPRISTAKPGFYNPANAARQSVEDHEDLASPTLAQIYLMQGNKEMAIEIYRRLMLLYPEKSHFFAAQIEKIQHH